MRARIDPGTSEQISLNPREPSLSVDPTIEGLRPLPSCQVAVPDSPATRRSLLNVGQGGALPERTTTTRTAKDGTATTTVRERFTPPDWRADGWFLERRHPAEWSRRTELVVPDHEKAAAVDPLVGVHDELRLARPCARARLAHRREAAPRRSVHSIRA